MTLRRKLIYLHTAFAVFAVGAAFFTIYGVQLHVRGALTSFERLVDQSILADRLRVAAQRQLVEMHDIVSRRKAVNAAYLARRDVFFTRLTEMATFAAQRPDREDWQSLLSLKRELHEELDRCLALLDESRDDEAETLLTGRIEAELMSALDTRLQDLTKVLNEDRWTVGNKFLTTDTQLLLLAIVIGATGVGLVAVGAIVVRRWLIAPVARLHEATRQYANGRLDYRVEVSSNDELGSLASSLNEMASSLQTSQTKYRSLFENLRDAVIICDSGGAVVECRDSDTGLLGLAPEAAIGRRLVDIWPQWQSPTWDWGLVIARVAAGGERLRGVDVELPLADGRKAIVDVVAYPIEYSHTRYAAILLRDVSERHRLQGLVRRSETMEATVTFAQGVAHDFKNLLNSAVTTLSLKPDPAEAKDDQRAQTALRACKQAARLARRLSEFAANDRGSPELLNLSETVELILDSLDEPFLAPLRVRTEIGRSVQVKMDRDHLTQIVLNLIHNAREAMPQKGELFLATGTEVTTNPVARQASSTYAVLTVADTGCGMSPEVMQRLFEPFFSTKPRGPSGRRGLGLSVVYAAVNNAGGFVQVESQLGVGTTFRVFLPVAGTAPAKDPT
ncbi:MAG: HAMP domain-containing protein, partial [Planctomycetes bacterium]|nr:HAMP domain-containing protein [Planctomycetota bacterium]